MRTDLLQRDLAAIFRDAEALPPSAGRWVRIGGNTIPCEPAQPFDGLSPDMAGEWGDFSGRIIVEADRLPSGTKAGDVCTYGGERRRITGMSPNVDGLTVELTLAGVRA